ncbi:hypothetical protein AVEN_238879-1 [Araneus ventricosus]|uniref:Uncharacterized protein n=1 Tax=Araneus ventricosus TaxID=182803 RepID=A0A4Y2INI5_ARAVE|nr:hypothetical protein AVEN_238879-1 [Araneus ventricosus]
MAAHFPYFITIFTLPKNKDIAHIVRKEDSITHLHENEYLGNGEHKSQEPGSGDHPLGLFDAPRAAKGGANGLVPVVTHGGQDEGGAGQRHDLPIDDHFAGGCAQYPLSEDLLKKKKI